MDIEKMTVEQLKAAAAKCEKLENEKRTGEKFQCVILSDRFIYVERWREDDCNRTFSSALRLLEAIEADAKERK